MLQTLGVFLLCGCAYSKYASYSWFTGNVNELQLRQCYNCSYHCYRLILSAFNISNSQQQQIKKRCKKILSFHTKTVMQIKTFARLQSSEQIQIEKCLTSRRKWQLFPCCSLHTVDCKIFQFHLFGNFKKIHFVENSRKIRRRIKTKLLFLALYFIPQIAKYLFKWENAFVLTFVKFWNSVSLFLQW